MDKDWKIPDTDNFDNAITKDNIIPETKTVPIDLIFGNPRFRNRITTVNELIQYPSNAISTVIERADDHVRTPDPSFTRKRFGRRRKKRTTSEVSQSSHETLTSEISTASHLGISLDTGKKSFDFETSDIKWIVRKLKQKVDRHTQTEEPEKLNQYVQVIPNTVGNPDRPEQQRTIQSLRNQIKQLTYIIEEMSKERSKTNLYVHQMQKRVNIQEFRIKEFETEMAKLLTDREHLTRHVEMFRQENIHLKNERQNLNEQWKSKQQVLSKKMLDGLRLKCLHLKEQLDNLKKDYQRHLNDFGQHQSRLEFEVTNELWKKINNDANVNNEIGSSENSCQDHLRNENEQLKQVVEHLRAEIFKMKNELSAKDQLYQKNKDECNQWIRKSETLTKDNEELRGDICPKLQAEISSWKAKYEELLPEMERYQSDLQGLRSEMKQLVDERDQNEQRHQNELRLWKEEIDTKNDQILKLDSNLKLLRDKCEQQEEKIKLNEQLVPRIEKNPAHGNDHGCPTLIDEKNDSSTEIITVCMPQSLDDNNHQPPHQSLSDGGGGHLSELAKERERCKGLTLALARERRQNAQLEDELRQARQSDPFTDQMKAELIEGINQLKSMALDSQQSSQEYLEQIQCLVDRLEQSSPIKPLPKLHSSIEDLKREFQNLKMTFLQT